MGSPLSGPFFPNEIVTFCYTINDWQQINCNYLQGIVPTFGNCWDPVSFNLNQEPINIITPLTTASTISSNSGLTGCIGNSSGNWSWFPSGSVTDNFTNNPLSAGWFFLTSYNSASNTCNGAPIDPDNSYGDGSINCNENFYDWQVCFQLKVSDQNILNLNDCSVSINTYSDGGIGIYSNTGCSGDLPTVLQLQKCENKQIKGVVFNDFNSNCLKDSIESFNSIPLTINIQPNNIFVQTQNGQWYLDSLPVGNYIATIETSGQWKATCSPTVSFTVSNPDSFVQVTSIGMKNTNPCTDPEISIIAPNFNQCLSNQIVYVEAKNLSTTSQVIYNSYADVKLDSFLTINSSTRLYTSLGNNTYRFQLDSLDLGQSKTWQISTTVSCSAQLGRTLTIQANLYPVELCNLDSTPNIISGIAPCLTAYDNSHLTINGLCTGDSVRFVIKNTGSIMDCFMPTRMFLDNVLQNADSVKLNANDSLVIKFLSDGRTWRLETEQHPLHPGNSHPNATVEACGNSTLVTANWTPNLVATMPQDDADPVVDIYCGVVSGSFDPNDKTGYPTGVDFGNYILPNQQMQYVIRFQNTGTDTAFKVVIRDTLETDLNIFSVVSGVSSHNYSFRMYGPRILEWTFNNIMLPDSFHSEPNSHGFVTFTVEQNENLPSGTSIDNSAAIYFDFNAPIITNVAHHEIQSELLTTGVDSKVAKGDVLVYPNPNNGLFKVELPSSLPSTPIRQQKITICNVMGQVVYISTPLNEQSIEIDLSKQPNGIYFLKVENGEMEWNKKVVKN